MKNKETEGQEILNSENQHAGEIINADNETELERDNKEADEVIAETEGVISLMKKVQDELESMKDKFLRLNAEFDNYKRRTTKERIDLIKTANSDVMTALLPVLDDFERALKTMNGDDLKTTFEGVNLIYSKLKSILEQKGLKAMDSIGKTFDLELHEAISQLPSADKHQKEKIVDEVERGYFLNDKVIRHAKVVVYN